MTARLVYMGTPEFACPALEMLSRRPNVEIGMVVTQPDRPSGRGRRMQSTAVAQAAERLALPIYRVGSLRSAQARQLIVDLQPDLIVVAAFGLILGRSILELPRRGCVNLHASLLPAYRGANPIAMAVRDGAGQTGVSLMRMEQGLDTGPVYATASVDITVEDTTASLTSRLGESAGLLLDQHLSDLLAGNLPVMPQPAGATCTRPMTKDDGWIDWGWSADLVERHVRAMWSWPRAWTSLPNGERLQVHRCHVAEMERPGIGVAASSDGGLAIGCGQQALVLDTVQLSGGRPVPGASLLTRGVIEPGQVLGVIGAPPLGAPLVDDC